MIWQVLDEPAPIDWFVQNMALSVLILMVLSATVGFMHAIAGFAGLAFEVIRRKTSRRRTNGGSAAVRLG